MSQVTSSEFTAEQQVNSLPVKLTLLLVSTLTVMAGATIAPSLPAMRQHFANIPNADYWVRLVLTAPALFIAIAAPAIGVLIDKLGRKPLLVTALVTYGIAGSTGLWLNQIGHILVGRGFLGLAVAGITTTATALIADYYTGPARGQFLGLQSAFTALGGVFFLTFGGFLADVNWRMPFSLYLVALLLAPGVAMFLPEPERGNTAAGGQSNTDDRFPTLAVTVTYLAALLAQIVFYLIPTQLPFLLKSLVNATASQSGLAIALGTLFAAISSLSYGKLKSKLSFMTTYSLAFFGMALGYAMISKAQGYGLVLPGLMVAGLGLGLLGPNMVTCLTSVAPVMARGRILGGLTTAMFLGQFLSPLVSQSLSRTYGLSATYGMGGWAMVGLGIVALIIQSRWK
jgi:MFS family permease